MDHQTGNILLDRPRKTLRTGRHARSIARVSAVGPDGAPIAERIAPEGAGAGVARSIVLRAPSAVTNRIPFVVTVDVHAVSPGQRISVTLEEKRGEGPMGATQNVEITAGRGSTGFASFQMILRERGTVHLVATARDDAGAHFQPVEAIVEVL